MFASYRVRRYSVVVLGMACIVGTVLYTGCTGTHYPQIRMSLVWETTIPGDYALLNCLATGGVDVALKPQDSSQKYRSEIHIDPTGHMSSVVNLSTLANDAWDDTSFFPLADGSGWVAVDTHTVVYTYVRQTETGGTISGAEEVKLDSHLRKINREGKMEWERPGLAGVSVLCADSSVVCIYGKDPAVLRDIDRSQMFSNEYAQRVLQRYTECPTVVEVIAGTTGSLLSSIQISPGLTPIAFLRESLWCEGPAIVAERWQGGVRQVAVFSMTGGHEVLRVDWGDLMPQTNVVQVLVLRDRMVAAGSNGAVSLLSREGTVLWTRYPKGARYNQDAKVTLLGSPDGNMIAVSTRFAPSLPRSPVWEATVQLTVFDADGNTVLNHGNLEQVVYTESGKIFATAKTAWEAKDHLYLFDFSGGQVNISRTEIPAGDEYRTHFSPTGRFVAITCRELDSGATKIQLYAVEGAE